MATTQTTDKAVYVQALASYMSPTGRPQKRAVENFSKMSLEALMLMCAKRNIVVGR